MKRATRLELVRFGEIKALVLWLGLVLAVVQLAGCATAPPVEENGYNLNTGYPPVVDRPWHL